MKKSSDNVSSFQKYGFPLLLFVTAFTVHWIVGSKLQMLNMSHDEFGVLACAARLCGEDWSTLVSEIGYYGYGSSLLYVPVFMITKGAFLRYRLIILINSCIMSLIPLAAYRISVRRLGISRLNSFCISMAAGLYPGYLLYSKYVWNETMMCFIPWCLLLLMFRLYHEQKKTGKILWSMLLALTLVYIYAVHSRSLAIIASVFLIILVLWIFRKKMLPEPVSFVSVFAAAWILNGFVKKWFVNSLWLVSDGGQLNNTVGGSAGKISEYMTPSGFAGLLTVAFGQLSSSFLSSYGLSVFLIVAVPGIICFAFNRKQNENGISEEVNLLNMTSFLFFASAFCISILFLGVEGSKEETRGDYFLYTRYFSNTLGIVCFSALVFLEKYELKARHFVTVAVSAVISVIPAICLAESINKQNNISNATILNLLAHMGKNPRNYVSYADMNNLIFSVSVVFLLTVLAYRRKEAVCAVLSAVFIWNFMTTGFSVLVPNSDKNSEFVRREIMALALTDGLAERCSDVYYYDVHQKKAWSSSAMQFALPEFRITEIYDELDSEYDIRLFESMISENSIVISTEDLELENVDSRFCRLDEDYLDTGIDYIWVYGSEIKSFMEQNGSVFAD